MHGTPQYLRSWLPLAEQRRYLIVVQRKWAGRLSPSHFPPPALQKHSWAPKVDTLTLPCTICTDPIPPTQDCELVALSHTHWQGASVTADCDRNGWKLLLPLSSLTLYIVVSLPHSFTLSGGFVYAWQEWSPTWVPPPLSPSLLLYSFTTSLTFNSFCLSAFYTPPHCPSLYM